MTHQRCRSVWITTPSGSELNANTNAPLTQAPERSHYTTRVLNRFTNATQTRMRKRSWPLSWAHAFQWDLLTPSISAPPGDIDWLSNSDPSSMVTFDLPSMGSHQSHKQSAGLCVSMETDLTSHRRRIHSLILSPLPSCHFHIIYILYIIYLSVIGWGVSSVG